MVILVIGSTFALLQSLKCILLLCIVYFHILTMDFKVHRSNWLHLYISI